MIVTFPASYRHDEPFQPSYYEQFLLEKVSSLELQIVLMTNSFKKILDIFDKSQPVSKSGQIVGEKPVTRLKRTEFKELSIDGIGVYHQIIKQHNGKKQDLFNQLIKDGFKFYSQNEEKQSLRTFERAVTVSPKNIALLTFLGKILFEQENNKSAEKYLEKAREIAPNDEKLLLLSATIYADSERFDEAKDCLDSLPNNADSAFCVNFIKGFVLFAKEEWLNSLKAFQECMGVLPCAESAYLFGCILYQVKQDELAKQVLEMAVKFDESFADAWFMLSRTCLNSSEKADAENYLKKASEAKDSRSQCFEFLNGKKAFPQSALPFIGSKFFLKGSKRLSELFKKELNKILD